MKKALLVLADGTVFKGQPLGYKGEAIGEVVFNTAMTGYQEILTDPSYKGQMVLMTCPQIGNYGVNPEDPESRGVWADGFIIKEAAPISSNWRSKQSLQEYLIEHQVVGIQAIDTRALTRHIREFGSQQGIISHTNLDHKQLIQQVRQAPSIVGRDLVSQVTCQHPYEWKEGSGDWIPCITPQAEKSPKSHINGFRTVVMDFGVKQNILRRLVDIGCHVQVVPATTTVEEVQALNPHGIILSNGPGDPEGVPYAVEAVRQLIGWRPIMGICLGHQILGMALGMKAHKLKFGHHGANHPVLDLRNRKVEITSQNHNFAVELTDETVSENLQTLIFGTPWGRAQITHRSLNDGCCEGIIGLDTAMLSVQYHPEASPGPHDSSSLFDEFLTMVERYHE